MSDLNRRDFVMTAVCAAGACMMCGVGEAEAQPAEGGAKAVDVGTAADYPKDGAYDKLADSKKVIVVRQGTRIFALTAICTHKMNTVKVKGAELLCSKHNSHFAYDGKPTGGPAKAALFHLGISTNAEGHIIVDPSKKFGEKQWNDAGASIEVKA